ncbi:hypothetical protein [Streptosporangium sp. CA-115845]|uniref:hypothetical protein n=1 Tax=Streptosporangium sp. CA-115845 TaxID=3240071 RepID=UPI003D9261FF
MNFQQGRKYFTRAYNAKTDEGTLHVTFTSAFKKKLTMERILLQDQDEQHPDEVDVLLSTAEFTARAQHYC